MPNHTLHRLRQAAAVCFGLAIIVASLSTVPAGASIVSDKVQHFAAYGIWALLVTASPRGLGWITAYVLVVVATGAAIELIQPMMGRTGSWLDLAANLAGIAAGTAIGLLLRERLYPPAHKAAARG